MKNGSVTTMSDPDSMMFEVPLSRLNELTDAAKRAQEFQDAVYKWLVKDLCFPLDMNMSTDKPAWMDIDRLARTWNEQDDWGITQEEAVAVILSETGWDADKK